MQELEVTRGQILSVWWLLLWRGICGYVIAAFLVGVGWAFVDVTYDVPAVSSGRLPAVIMFMGGPIIGFFVTGMALRKIYGEFRVVLVPRSSN